MKHLSTKIFIFTLLVVAALSGYNYFKKPFLQRFAQFEEQMEAIVLPEQDPIQRVLDELSPREKVLQMISLPVLLSDPEASVSAELAWVQANQPGFVGLFGSNLTMEEVTEFVGQAKQSNKDYAPLIAVDHEGGSVQRLRGEGFSILPSWRTQCQATTADRKATFTQSASELAQAGVQLVFAPVLDVAQAGSFLGSRACQTEEDAVAAATDFITSFAQYGILPVVKHFPGIGAVRNDLHFALDSVELQPQDTGAFNQILAVFPNIGVMTAHVAVVDRTDGVPCSLSAVCLDIFPVHFPEALLFTDALEMPSAAGEETQTAPKTLSEVAIQAALAGNHVLVFGEKVTVQTIEEIVAVLAVRYNADPAFAQKVDASARKILELKLPSEQP